MILGYYTFGLKQKGYNYDISPNVNALAQKTKYQGQELEEELGKNTYAYQWRDYDPAIGRFNKIDRLAEKYQSMTPYHFSAGNPILYREIAGDSINVSDIQSRIITTSGVSVSDVLEADLESTSGLTLDVNASGNLEYETEKGFLGIKRAKVTRDANGKKVGSSKARRRLKRAIASKETINVIDNTGGDGSSVETGTNNLFFDITQPSFLIGAKSSDLSAQSVGPALNFYHELDHTEVGGGRSDPTGVNPQRPGAVARRSNQIRRQLGSDFGMRATYGTTTINGTTYMPFSRKSRRQLRKGTVPTSLYLKF